MRPLPPENRYSGVLARQPEARDSVSEPLETVDLQVTVPVRPVREGPTSVFSALVVGSAAAVAVRAGVVVPEPLPVATVQRKAESVPVDVGTRLVVVADRMHCSETLNEDFLPCRFVHKKQTMVQIRFVGIVVVVVVVVAAAAAADTGSIIFDRSESGT